MKITVTKPRTDLGENLAEHIDIELSDEDICRIVKRYFELNRFSTCCELILDAKGDGY